MELPQQPDIAIVGGGMVGLTLACALADTDLQVLVIDPGPETSDTFWQGVEAAQAEGYDPRVSALTRASQQILDGVGAWRWMQTLRVSPYRHMSVWDGEGTAEIDFDAAELHSAHLGHIVENRVTLAGLHRVLGERDNLTLLSGRTLAALEPAVEGRRALTLDDGLRLSARLVVAADGARSQTRRLAGLGISEWDYEHHAIVTTVRTAEPHRHTAWQRFTEDGPLAFLPLAGEEGRVCSIVWSTSPDHARELMDLDAPAFCQALERAFEGRLGAVVSADPRFCFPLTQRHAPDYVAEGFALVGDAAHSIHPLAGQGVNLGLLDAAVLAEEIAAALARGSDFASLSWLRRYQRRRQGDNLKMIGLMAAFRHLYGEVPPPLHWLRNLGMHTVNRLAPLKQFLARQAMGDRPDLPVLARTDPDRTG